MRNVGIGFGWTKNRALLKLEPGQEVWEDLYPAGSILTIIHAHKSAMYTCNVAHHSTSVRVEVTNRTLIPVCPDDSDWGLDWRDTAPGSKSMLQCPEGFVGRYASRQCTMKDAANSEWEIPDFSGCLYEPLLRPYNDVSTLTKLPSSLFSCRLRLGFHPASGPLCFIILLNLSAPIQALRERRATIIDKRTLVQ
jgi:hypothetical protein